MKISGLTIACFNIKGMSAFYQNVFQISFGTVKITQGNIYVGSIDNIQVTLCPASMANIKAEDNRHQLTFLIDDMNNALKKTKQYGGTVLQDIQEADTILQASIKDVDGNSIVLKQKLQ